MALWRYAAHYQRALPGANEMKQMGTEGSLYHHLLGGGVSSPIFGAAPAGGGRIFCSAIGGRGLRRAMAARGNK